MFFFEIHPLFKEISSKQAILNPCLFSMEDTASWLKAVLAGMIFVNGVLGPTMAYPALLKKGLPILGLGNEIKRGRSSKKRA